MVPMPAAVIETLSATLPRGGLSARGGEPRATGDAGSAARARRTTGPTLRLWLRGSERSSSPSGCGRRSAGHRVLTRRYVPSPQRFA